MKMNLEELEKHLEKRFGEEIVKLVSTAQEKAAEELAEQRDALKAELEEIKKQRTEYMAKLTDAAKAAKENDAPFEHGKGLIFARFCHCIAAGRGDNEKAAAYALNKLGDAWTAKALSAGTDSEGGFLIPEEVATDVIELLRSQAVVESLGPVSIPLAGNTLRLPKISAGASGGWIGENANAPASQPTFGTVNLTPKKYASLTPISNDLVRRAPQNVQGMIRDDLVADIASASDLAYIRGSGAGGQPTGMKNQTGINTFASTGTTAALIIDDLIRAIRELLDDNVRMIRPGWIFAPRTWQALTKIRESGLWLFKEEMDRGTLFGFPWRRTSQIPINLGAGTDESEVYLADMADVVVGTAVPVAVDVSDSAAYHDGTNVVAAFSLDQTVVRAIIETDLVLRHAESVNLITAVKWV